MQLAPDSRCGFTLLQECISLSLDGVFHLKCGLDHFHPPATIQELQEGCVELEKMKVLRRYQWLEGNHVQLTIREGIHEDYQ